MELFDYLVNVSYIYEIDKGELFRFLPLKEKPKVKKSIKDLNNDFQRFIESVKRYNSLKNVYFDMVVGNIVVDLSKLTFPEKIKYEKRVVTKTGEGEVAYCFFDDFKNVYVRFDEN